MPTGTTDFISTKSDARSAKSAQAEDALVSLMTGRDGRTLAMNDGKQWIRKITEGSICVPGEQLKPIANPNVADKTGEL
jgi:hypothetical protein